MAKQNYVLLNRITLTSSASSVTFSSIPQTGYTDLKIVVSGRDSSSAGTSGNGYSFTILPNGLNTNISQRSLFSNGSGPASYNDTQMYTPINMNADTANTYSNVEIYVSNYTSSSPKSFSIDGVTENNAASSSIRIAAGLWNSTSPITTIQFNAYSTWMAGSSFSLYGIANASTTPTSSPKAFGGDIVRTDGTYWYHAFLSSGAFTTPINLNADILIVGGGGGGSNSGGIGSGGGGGAIRYQSSVSLISGSSSAVMVGAGGAKDDTSVGDGRSGTQSSFASTIAQVANRAKGSNSSSGRVGGDGGNSTITTGGIVSEYFGGLGAASSYPRRGGSGAGAGNNGSSSYPAVGGNGSNTWSSWATATGTGDSGYFSGGGAGGYEYNGSMSRTAGGLGGGGMGGAGTSAPNYNATDGTANTGGGGGGCGGQSGVIGGSSGNGGSGIVIIRYLA